MTQTREERASHRHAHYIAHREEIAVKGRAERTINPEKRKEYQRSYQISHLEYFRAYNRASYERHKEQRKTKTASYKRTHLDKIRAWSSKYKAQKRKAIIGTLDYLAIKERDCMICCICGKRVTEKTLSFDHSWPLSLGGPHSQENLRVAHLRCNIKRGAGKLPVQMVLV